MNYVASIKKGVLGWLKNLRDPLNLFQEPVWKLRVEFLVFTLLSPILIPYLALSERVREWRRYRRLPPIFQLLDRNGGFQLSELEELIASGVDVDARERNDGETPLIYSARVDRPWDPNFRGALEVCRVLLEAGADPNADCEGFYSNRSIRPSPIYFAYLSGNVELLELLLEFGANPRSEAWSHSVDVVPQPDAWLERQRPEIRDRLRQWKAEREEKRLEETLPDATETAPKIRARL